MKNDTAMMIGTTVIAAIGQKGSLRAAKYHHSANEHPIDDAIAMNVLRTIMLQTAPTTATPMMSDANVQMSSRIDSRPQSR